jgi:hypothetical protein
MSNKTALWIVGAAAVVVIIALIAWGGGGSDTPESDEGAQNEQPAGSSSFRELLASSTPQECTFTDAETGTQGTMYISGGKMRGDFAGEAGADSHMIVTGDTLYLWGEGMSTGFKTTVQASTGSNAQVDLDHPVNYECRSTAVSSSRFDLPAGVTFTTI